MFSKKIAGAKASGSGNYPVEGRFWALINVGKLDQHSGNGQEQLIFESTIIRVVDPGPTGEARWKPSKGGNLAPHSPGDPCTFYFSGEFAAPRAKKFLLVCTDTDERSLPTALNPKTGETVTVPPGATIPGTNPPVLAVDPVEFLIDQAASPSVNALKNVVIEYQGTGITTQGRGKAGPQKIVATNPIKRIWAREVHEAWDSLAENVKQELQKDKRLEKMLAAEEVERAQAQAK